MRTSRSAFTIIELLAVISLMVILLAITISRMGNNHAQVLTANGDRIAMLARQARQIARTHQSLTALVVVNNSGNVELDHRALAVLELAPESPEWKQISAWERLPDTLRIAPEVATTFDGSPVPAIALPTLKWQGQDVSPSGYLYQIFRPDGRLLEETTPPSLELIGANGNRDSFLRIILSPSTAIPYLERP